MSQVKFKNWPSARHFAEALQCPGICFTNPVLRATMPAVDRLGMPLVTSGQFAYVYKLKSVQHRSQAYGVRCFRSHLGDREERYAAIDRHLQAHSIPALATFSYEPEGILVGGARYPILLMEWIDGPTLDVYLDEAVTRREVVEHLSHEWLKVIHSLQEAKIAHGDLQHGNIIVERGALRLVDLDGLFVPEMEGWKASELGHQHFQHPGRDEKLFDSALDNFSSLVIYLTLISLAERPELWKEHHDENLLFTKTDFLDPGGSVLFKKIKEIGSEHLKLAEALESCSKGKPDSAPSLLDLVEFQATLPNWMVAPSNVEVRERTREAAPVYDSAFDVGGSRWTPWDGTSQYPTPLTASTQSVSGSMARNGGSGTFAVQPGFGEISKVAFGNAKELVGRGFLWWYWGVYITLKFVGLEFFYSLPIAILIVAVISIVFGYIRAYNDAHSASLTYPLVPQGVSAGRPAPRVLASTLSAPAARASSPAAHVAANSYTIKGNRTLGIYHLPTCSWSHKIGKHNAVWFGSPVEAQTAGYRACKVCSPPLVLTPNYPLP
jgi:hypothetical protein